MIDQHAFCRGNPYFTVSRYQSFWDYTEDEVVDSRCVSQVPLSASASLFTVAQRHLIKVFQQLL